MIRATILGLATSLFLMICASGAQSQPSFDCAKSRGAIETLICADTMLAAADARMAKLYALAQISAFGKGASNQPAAQRDWIKSRNGCAQLQSGGKADSPESNALRDCVVQSYRERNAALAVAVLFDHPEAAIISLRLDYPKMAPLYEALQLYMAKPVDADGAAASRRENHDKAIALLKPYFADMQSDPNKGYGWSVLSGEAETPEESLAGDHSMAASLSILSLYVDNDDSVGGQPFPCAALVQRPDMISAAAPYFGSTLDNFLMRPECEDSLPAQPSLNALRLALNGFWGEECNEGTIRFATYRGYAQIVTSARIGLPFKGGKARPIQRKGLKPALVDAALAELEDQYQRYAGLSKAKAQKRARYWLGEMITRAGECP
jgi:uncharacterized protein